MAKPRYGAKRSVGGRSPIAFVYVVCDDRKTASKYFEKAITFKLGERQLKALPADSHGKTGEAVIEQASRRKDEADERDIVWALVDLEMKPNSKTLKQKFSRQAKKAKVKLALSQPCFEVWILSHLVYTGQSFANCGAVLSAVKNQWKAAFGHEFPDNKAHADYQKLSDQVHNAVANARKQNPQKAQSWTDIWRIFVPNAESV